MRERENKTGDFLLFLFFSEKKRVRERESEKAEVGETRLGSYGQNKGANRKRGNGERE